MVIRVSALRPMGLLYTICTPSQKLGNTKSPALKLASQYFVSYQRVYIVCRAWVFSLNKYFNWISMIKKIKADVQKHFYCSMKLINTFYFTSYECLDIIIIINDISYFSNYTVDYTTSPLITITIELTTIYICATKDLDLLNYSLIDCWSKRLTRLTMLLWLLCFKCIWLFVRQTVRLFFCMSKSHKKWQKIYTDLTHKYYEELMLVNIISGVVIHNWKYFVVHVRYILIFYV